MTNFAEQIDQSVMATGPGWLVVDKPSGVSVHNDPGRDVCSLVQALLTRDRHLAGRAGFTPGTLVHAPHRLDRDTSGLVLVCSTAEALTFYGRAFQTHRVAKRYLAILHGRLGAPGDRGAWSFPLTRAAGGRTHPGGKGPRVASRTAFHVIGHSEHYTLVTCAPLTGRKHQIRRHTKLAKHPVVGDRRYGSPRSLRYLRERAGFTRLGLHAWELDLPNPPGQQRRILRSRRLPEDFFRLLAGDSDRTAGDWERLVVKGPDAQESGETSV